MALSTRSYHVDLRNRKLSTLPAPILYPTRGAVQGEDDIYASNFTQEKALCFSLVYLCCGLKVVLFDTCYCHFLHQI
jgi:hypothetical protein